MKDFRFLWVLADSWENELRYCKAPYILWIKGIGSELGLWQGKGRGKDEKNKGQESGSGFSGSSAWGPNQAAIASCKLTGG